MLIRNEKAQGGYFRYYYNGYPVKVWIAGYSQKEIAELTDADQIIWTNVEARIHGKGTQAANQLLEDKFYQDNPIGAYNTVHVSSGGTTGYYNSLHWSVVPSDE